MAWPELATVLLALGAVLVRFAFPRAAPWLLAGAFSALGVALWTNPARWQLVPALLALALLALILARPRRFGGKSTLAALMLLGFSALLAHAFAVVPLPTPPGPYAVGTVSQTLTRPADKRDRQLFLKLWYPASGRLAEPEGLWDDLSGMTDIPAPLRRGLAYLRRLPTHTQRHLPYADGATLRVVLYNHAYVSWASENSLLAEDLASRGFTVVAVRHMGQTAEYEALDQDGSGPAADIAMAADIVARRAADSRFVAERLGVILAALPGRPSAVPSGYAAMGYSLGGAISTDLCTSDPKCRGVVNIDGAIPGVDYSRLAVPRYLMLAGGSHENVQPSRGTYQRRVFPRAAHADFHDSAVAVPLTRWLFGRSTAELARERREQGELIATFLASAEL